MVKACQGHLRGIHFRPGFLRGVHLFEVIAHKIFLFLRYSRGSWLSLIEDVLFGRRPSPDGVGEPVLRGINRAFGFGSREVEGSGIIDPRPHDPQAFRQVINLGVEVLLGTDVVVFFGW